MKPSHALLLIIVAALVGVAGASYWVTNSQQYPSEQPHRASLMAATGHTAVALASLNLPDTQGKPQPLSQWQGKVLVINFWATWCPPCREEMPGFSRLSTKYSANGVQFVGISIDTIDNVRHFEKTNPVSYPLLLGSMDTVQNTVPLGNSAQALPFTVVLDREGRVYASKLGRLPEETLEHHLKTLLKQ